MNVIVFGTNNKNKVKEIRNIFNLVLGDKYDVKIPSEILLKEVDVEENGKTIEENALIKATKYFSLTSLPTFADDTGLEVDALSGAPGVYSARYAGEPANDANNRAKLISALSDIDELHRTARFKTVICYKDDSKTKLVEGVCEGRIILDERGENGFGYDSIFIPRGYGMTFAEMSPEEKNKLSHRRIAIDNLLDLLK